MRSMIVVCLSPAIDRSYKVPSLTLGCMHRCENPTVSPGGKGVNVARVLSLLGAQVRCIGFFAGQNGQFIIRDLQQHHVIVDAVELKGETRNSINILDPVAGAETEILEKGPMVYPGDMEIFLGRLKQILSQETTPPIVIFSGGLPQGLAPSTYNDLIETAKRYKADCFLDSSGEAFSCGVEAKPFMIKPNMRELSQITNRIFERQCNVEEKFLRKIHQETRILGIPVVAVTLGGEGAMICIEDKVFYARPLLIQPINTIGSGDSFTAGFAYAMANQFSWKRTLELAVACATSNALFEQVGFIDSNQVKDFQNQVEIDEFIVE